MNYFTQRRLTFINLKTFAVVIFSLLFSISFGQWEATNASNSTNNSFTGFLEHNGNLFSTSYEGLKKWDANAEQWNSVQFSGFAINAQEYVGYLTSTGDYLYLSKWNPYCQSNIVYKSDDDGLTFVADTVGLPRSPVCSDTVTGAILAFFSLPNGKVVAEFGASFYTKSPTDASWVIDNTMQRFMAFTSNTWYRLNTNALYKSVDEGQNWTTASTMNFPPGLQPSVLEINSETGRIYMNAKYGFANISLYTDNEGATWDTLHVNDFLGNSYIGIPQVLRGLIAKGDYIIFGADQNANGTHSDVYASFDGGLTFAPDTVGLPSNAGIENVIELMFYNNELFMAFNGNEIYRKAEVLGMKNLETVNVQLYPNPTQNIFHIQSDQQIDVVIVYDLQGKLISNAPWNSTNSSMDLSNLENGIYVLQIRSGNQEVIQRVLKN